MKKCYVILMHQPNVECPEHEETNLWAVTRTLPVAEKAIVGYYRDHYGIDGNSIVCQVNPAYTDARTYTMSLHFGIKTATTFTVTEENIFDDWALE